jgi:hypothetical protein
MNYGDCDCKTARLQNCKTAELQNRRTAELHLFIHQYGHILHAFQ